MTIERLSCLPSVEALRKYRDAETARLKQQVARMLLKQSAWLQDAINYHRLSNK